jgi:hypothetical protein
MTKDHLSFVIPGRERSSRTRNPYAAALVALARREIDAVSKTMAQGLWIPGSRYARPGMTNDGRRP